MPQVKTGGARLSVEHAVPMIGKVALGTALGIVEGACASRLLIEQIDAGGVDASGELGINALLAAMHAPAPTNEIDAMLGAQMVATQVTAMRLRASCVARRRAA